MLNKIKNKISAFKRLTNNQENMCKNETEPKGFVQVQVLAPWKILGSPARAEATTTTKSSPAVVCGSVGE